MIFVHKRVFSIISAGVLPKEHEEFLWMKYLTGKIINGEETTIERVPYQVSLQYADNHHCGGSIIAKNWVLSAAHCSQSDVKDFTVLAGSANKELGGSRHKVLEFISHPAFDVESNVMINDIALIRVEEPFEYDETRKPIQLFAEGEVAPVGAMSIVTGWGSTGTTYPVTLNLIDVPIISKDKCSKLYNMMGGLPDGQICAAYDNGGKDACQGDSGGPLAINQRLAGITSWGIGCALENNPGVYTEVAYYRGWIKKHSGV